MKIVLIGASGTIGRELASALEAKHEVIPVSYKSTPLRIDLADNRSIQKLFNSIGSFDVLICVAGLARYGRFNDLTEDDFLFGISNKLMGQVNLVKHALNYIEPGGSIVLTGGTASRKPFDEGGASISMVNAALEGFVRAVANEMPDDIRINLVAPGWATETLEDLGMDTSQGIPASQMVIEYIKAIEGCSSGEVFDAD